MENTRVQLGEHPGYSLEKHPGYSLENTQGTAWRTHRVQLGEHPGYSLEKHPGYSLENTQGTAWRTPRVQLGEHPGYSMENTQGTAWRHPGYSLENTQGTPPSSTPSVTWTTPLSMGFLFSTFARTGKCHVQDHPAVQAADRGVDELRHHLARPQKVRMDEVPCLRVPLGCWFCCHGSGGLLWGPTFPSVRMDEVFLSIKGIYYQAEVLGQTITWLVPYQFSHDHPTGKWTTGHGHLHRVCTPLSWDSSTFRLLQPLTWVPPQGGGCGSMRWKARGEGHKEQEAKEAASSKDKVFLVLTEK
ncbi:unnamed protein product [Gadus morhua 'NCC']